MGAASDLTVTFWLPLWHLPMTSQRTPARDVSSTKNRPSFIGILWIQHYEAAQNLYNISRVLYVSRAETASTSVKVLGTSIHSLDFEARE